MRRDRYHELWVLDVFAAGFWIVAVECGVVASGVRAAA